MADTRFKKAQVPWNKGKKGIYSEEVKRKMSLAHKGKSTWIGKQHTEETKRKISDALKGKHHSEETKEKRRISLRTPEVRKRMSDSHKGKPSPRKGKHLSEENKKIHSAFMKEYYKTHKSPMLGRKGLIAWNKGLKFPEISGRMREKILKQYESGIFPRQSNTKPERQIKEELLKRGYILGEDFIHQYTFMNKFMCDFCFPQQNVVVEVYGDFWHSNPKIYPNPLHKHQIIGAERDKLKETYITTVDNHAWTYLVLWESDIKRDVAQCVDVIEEALAEKNIAKNIKSHKTRD